MILLEKQTGDGGGEWFNRAALIATDAMAEETLTKMKDGQKVKVEATRISGRSYVQLSCFFAILNTKIFPNQDQFLTVDKLREALLIEAGHCELREKLNGERYYVADSISYRDCDHDTMTKLFDSVFDIACKQWGFTHEDLGL